jgi:hypothetical protein
MNDYMYHPTNYKKEFNDDFFYNQIIIKVEKTLIRKLRNSEINEVVSFIQKLDPALLTPEYKNKTIPIIITTLTDEFKKYNCTTRKHINSQQILKDTIGLTSESGTSHGVYDDPSFHVRTQPEKKKENTLEEKIIEQLDHEDNNTNNTKNVLYKQIAPVAQNFLGMSNSEEAVRVMNPSALHRKNFMLLDSRYRILSSNDIPGIATYSWNYVLKSQIEAQGSVNIIGNVRDIIALRVYPFRIPYVASADNKYSRISVFIEELGSQSFVAHESRKFHFMLRSKVDSEFIELETDQFNDGSFYFEKPITTLNTLTISFGSPLEQVIFPIDRSWCTIDYFTLAPLTKITTYTNSPLSASLQQHGLSNGDRVYFDLFNVGDASPALVEQTLINQNIKNGINKNSGFLVTVIGGSTSTEFTIDYDTSNIQNPVSDIRFKVFFGSKRMFIPIELTYIMPAIQE